MDKARIALVPSNQHHNYYAGDPNDAPGLTTEEQWAIRACNAAWWQFEQGGHTVKMFHVPGAGNSNVDELVKALDQMKAWKPDLVLSIHSNTGSTPERRYIYPLVAQKADVAWADRIGREYAGRTGLIKRYPSVRTDLAFSHRVDDLGVNKGVLLEIGQHNIKVDAKYNWQYAQFLGLMAARSLMKVCGLPFNEDPIAWRVPLPPGQERWRWITPETPGLYQHPMWRSTPMMTGEDVKFCEEKLKLSLGRSSWAFARAVAGWLRGNGEFGITMQLAVRVQQWLLGWKSNDVIDIELFRYLENVA